MAARRTRSSANTTEHEAPVATRATRRTRKQNIDEDEINEELLPTAEIIDNDIQMDDGLPQFDLMPQNDDNGSSNFAFEDNLTFEQQSEGKGEEETNQTDETIDRNEEEFIADLAEENANSFPSADGNSNSNAIQESLDDGDVQMIDEMSMDKTEDTYAQSEDIKNHDQHATDLDAENISEDELPAPTKPKVQDAEEVSDEELPGPKMAELPADTENVSEEELPASQTTSKKEKRKLQDYDPSEPTDESDAPEKKLKKDDEAEKKYRLPDLEKYWKAVLADGEDFNAWTYLLQYVDSENDVEHAREAYDAFLSRYCYCYGYWRKYADYEKKKGSLEKCDEVFERGLKAIPLSIDLWIHYLTHIKQKHQDDRECIRSQFERALEGCGLEFRSDKLWEGYIRWENEEKDLIRVVAIYDRLLATPTQGYKNHMENFRELVNNNPVQKLIPIEEFKKYREEVRKDSTEPKTDDEIPPGEDEADDHLRNEDEGNVIRKIIINKRKKINKATVEMINKRWTFEEGIKRPYFHVKQLEKIQLKNWKDYLDFEIEQGDKKRILVLFERCLIACALYEEFWIKLIRYLETNQDDPEYETRTRDVYERACTIHHPDKPSLHLMWSAFEEIFGNIEKAISILENLDKKHPNLLQVAYRRINLERRRGNYEKSLQLYEHYISTAKNKHIISSMSIKYSRFLNKIMSNYEKAMEVLKKALEKDGTNTRIALQMVDLALQRPKVDDKEVLEILDKFVQQESLDAEQKLLFAQRKVEFLEDFGSSVKELNEAQKVLQTALEKSKENKKKTSEHETTSKKSKDSGPNGGTYSSSAYNYQGYSNSSSYPQSQWSGNYNYDYNQWSSYNYGGGQSSYGYGNSY